MTMPSDHHDSAFFADLPPELCRLDASLADLVARERVPDGLTDRVHRASAANLPRRLRLAGTLAQPPRRAIPLHRTRWAQVAMAAGIALTFVVGAWFLAGPQPVIIEPRGLLADAGPTQPEVRTVAYRPRALTPEAAQLLLVSAGGDSHLVELFESRGSFAHDDSYWFDDHEL